MAKELNEDTGFNVSIKSLVPPSTTTLGELSSFCFDSYRTLVFSRLGFRSLPKAWT